MKNKTISLDEQLDELKRNKKNIFLYGMSGSGKDTSADYIRDEYGYLKLRLADTIKRIICEKEGLTYDELEELKRTNPEFRQMHNTVGSYLDATGYCVNDEGDVISVRRPTGTINRIHQIINKTAFDFQYFSKDQIKHMNIVVCDCRTREWCEIFLQHGWTGIFLTRTTEEFGLKNHATEQNMFYNGEISELLKSYSNQMIIVCNDIDKDSDFFHNISELGDKMTLLNTVESSKDALLETIDKVMEITGVDKKYFENVPVKLQHGKYFGKDLPTNPRYEITLKKFLEEYKTEVKPDEKHESEPGFFSLTPFFEPTSKQEFERKFSDFDINPNQKFIPEVGEIDYFEAEKILTKLKGNDILWTDVLILRKYLFGWKFIFNLSEDKTSIKTLKFIYNVEHNPAWTFLTLEYSNYFDCCNVWTLKSTFSEKVIYNVSEGFIDNTAINEMLDVCETIGLKNRLKQYEENGIYIGFDILSDIELMKPYLLNNGFRFEWGYVNGNPDVPHFYREIENEVDDYVLFFNESKLIWEFYYPMSPSPAISIGKKMNAENVEHVCKNILKLVTENEQKEN